MRRRLLLEESNDVPALEPTPDGHIALGVNSMNLKNRLCDVETDRRHSLHGPVLRIRSPTATMAPTCRWRSRPQHHYRTSRTDLSWKLGLLSLRARPPSTSGPSWCRMVPEDTAMATPGHPGRVERRLAAILAADVAGYSRLMGADEAGTAKALREHRAAVDPIVAGHGGRIVKTTGDGVLLEFQSIVAAVECALAIQAVMA